MPGWALQDELPEVRQAASRVGLRAEQREAQQARLWKVQQAGQAQEAPDEKLKSQLAQTGWGAVRLPATQEKQEELLDRQQRLKTCPQAEPCCKISSLQTNIPRTLKKSNTTEEILRQQFLLYASAPQYNSNKITSIYRPLSRNVASIKR